MKKGFLLSVICLISAVSFAQNFSLGFNLSPNVGWLSATDNNISDNYSYDYGGNTARLGMAYGIMTEYHFTENYHLAVGINHLMTGGKFKAEHTDAAQFGSEIATQGVDGEYYFKTDYSPMKINYLHIPIALRLKTNEIGYLRYFGNIGFAGAFNIGSKTNINMQSYVYENNELSAPVNMELENIKLQPRFLATYFQVGLGAQYSMGGNTLLHFGIDANIGLGNVVSKREYEDYSNIAENATVKNSYVALNIGIFL